MESSHRRKRITFVLFAFFAWVGFPMEVSAEPPEAAGAPRMSLVHLREMASKNEWSTLSFQLQGVVCAFHKRLGLVMLDDGTSTDLLELPSLPPDLRPGDRVVINAANCQVSRGPNEIRLGTAPLVDIDGSHPPLSASGSVFLGEGTHPLRVEWFNGHADATLNLEYEGEGLPRQKVPTQSLCHSDPERGETKPGLEYRSYVVDDMLILPNFSKLTPKARGVVPDLDVSVRARPEMAALVFTGLLRVPGPGRYQFHLTSDDGARLYVADAPVTCDIDPTGKMIRSFAPESLKSDLDAGTVGQWVVFEGLVKYAAKVRDRLELEVTGRSRTFHVTVMDGAGLNPTALLQKRIRVAGLKRDSGIVAIDKAQLLTLSDEKGKEKVLTQVVEIRQLQRDEASKPYKVEIQGVVTMATPRSLVVQDATGGVFVHYQSQKPGNLPHPMELWRIEGRTGPGDFAPVIHANRATCIGSAPLPMAVQPTQQQLASGSLDSEMVEIEGVVTAASTSEIILLTRGGKATVKDDWLYPLPTTGMSKRKLASLVGSVVRLRGVYRSIWDTQTGNAQSGVSMLGNASMSVSEPVSEAPFSEPLTRASDLLLFTSHPTVLRRVRIKGQLLHARPPELFLFDGTSGFRGIANGETNLSPGDEVEVTGFPQLGGPSPVLLDARARKVGHSPLPAPAIVPYWNLPDERLDSSMVEVEATLLSNTVRQDERSLEMQAGSNRFVAIIPSGISMPQGIVRDSVLRLTGVYISAATDRALSNSNPFEMRLAGTESIVVVKRGPWWTRRHTITVISILSLALVLTVAWVALLRRSVTRRTSELAVEIEEREMNERHRAMEKERSRMAKDLHDELGSGITVAGLLSSLMKNPDVTQEQKDGYLDQLGDLCRNLVTGLDEIVWAVNPHYDSVADLAGYFSLYAERFLKLAGLECRITIDQAITKDPLDSRRRHQIFLAFKESLNNIVRHSEAKMVLLNIEVSTGNLVISLTDDGCGFEQSVDSPGSDGLRNMKERIRALGGTCTIKSKPREGTTVQFEISLKNTRI